MKWFNIFERKYLISIKGKIIKHIDENKSKFYFVHSFISLLFLHYSNEYLWVGIAHAFFPTKLTIYVQCDKYDDSLFHTNVGNVTFVRALTLELNGIY